MSFEALKRGDLFVCSQGFGVVFSGGNAFLVEKRPYAPGIFDSKKVPIPKDARLLNENDLVPKGAGVLLGILTRGVS